MSEIYLNKKEMNIIIKALTSIVCEELIMNDELKSANNVMNKLKNKVNQKSLYPIFES